MNSLKFVKGLKMLGFGILFVGAAGWITLFLWNWLMPALFGLPVLNFLQALGLLALARLLFGGRPGGHWGGGQRKHYWMHRMKHRWEQMSPEERSAWKERMQGKSPWAEQA